MKPLPSSRAALPDGLVRGVGGLVGFAVYLLGLFGTCALFWWGAVALGWWWNGDSGLGLVGGWITALPYMCAWVVLSFASPGKAVLAALTFPIVLGATSFLGVIVGMATWLLLAVPGFVCAAAATGGFLALAQRLDRPVSTVRWTRIHLKWFSVAGLALVPASFIGMSSTPLAGGALWTAQIPVTIVLFFHAIESWGGLTSEGRARASPLRVLLLLATVYLGIGAAFVAGAPDRSLIAWPWAPGRDLVLRARSGTSFGPGETISVRGRDGAETLRVPEGWRARFALWSKGHPREVWLDPLPGSSPSALGPLQVFLFAAPDWLAAPGGEVPDARRRTRLARCTAQPPAPPGLVLCRREAAIGAPPGEPPFLAWDGLELEFVLGPAADHFSRGSYLVFGPGLRGLCGRGGRCMMEMPLAGGGSARFEMPEASLADVGHLQAEGERVLRAMGAGVVAPDRGRWSPLL